MLLAPSLLMLASLSLSCSNACDDAKEHSEECGVPVDLGEDCSGVIECQAQCVSNAECSAIIGSDPDGGANELYACKEACKTAM